MRIELQPAYVLHTRPYRDTSMLVDLITPEQGRVAVLAKGVRRGKSSRRALLNPFTRLLVSFQGKGGLKLLTGVESEGRSYRLDGAALYCGFYLNELLIRLLPEMDAHARLYHNYQVALEALSVDKDLEPLLRRFEFSLLEELGYGIDFNVDAGGMPLVPERYYALDPELGFTALDHPDEFAQPHRLFTGVELRAIVEGDLAPTDTRDAAKRLTRQMLQPLLGDKPLKSRELFKRF